MIFATVAFCVLHIHRVIATNQLDVNTTSGVIRGSTSNSHPGVAQYLGIPYAEKPIGARRWLPPAVKTRENTTIDATKFGHACTQWDFDPKIAPSLYNADITEFLIQPFEYQSEDCLSLSIWSPLRKDRPSPATTDSELLPVIVWLHGGGFVQGGTNVPYQNPAPWVSRSKTHIVVSINYRLGIFGFPNSVALPLHQQNLGLLDQRLGLEWVRSNIAKFGGDPERMVLMGQSAGAMSADYHNYAYPQDPIVSGFILHSGVAHVAFASLDTPRSNFTFVANQLDCKSTDAGEQLECLRKVSASDLNKFVEKYANDATQPALNFVPIVDNRTLFDDATYTARTLSGKFSRKPVIAGWTKDEGASLVPYNATFGSPQQEIDEMTRVFIKCPAGKTVRERYAANATTFRYLYSGNFSNISPKSWYGAYHSADLPLVFGTYDIARGKGTKFEIEVSEKIQDLWLAFAIDPANGLPKRGWNSYQNGRGNAIEFGGNRTVIQPIAEALLDEHCE